VVGRGNGGNSGGRPYGVYPWCKMLLVMQLSNIVIKLENCIHEDSYLHHRDAVLLVLHQFLHHLLVMLQCFIILVVWLWWDRLNEEVEEELPQSTTSSPKASPQ
jgi:hypothetical protein